MNVNTPTSLAQKVSRVVFFLYIIYVLMGGSTPFRDEDPSDAATSNPINQIADTTLPFIAALCLWEKRKMLFSFLAREKYLTIFLLWCLITITWSNYPFTSFKLWIRLVGSTTVILAFLLNAESPDEALKYFRAVLVIYIPLSFAAIAFVPAATQWEWPAWRGLSSHKNTLGQIACICTMIWAFPVYGYWANRKTVAWIFLGGSLLLLIGSKSSTAMTALAGSISLAIYGYIRQKVGSLVVLSGLSLFMVAAMIVDTGHLEAVESLTNVFGKDSTFTGRDEIWTAVIEESQEHFWLGCGIGAFWLAQNPAVERLWKDDKFPSKPSEAHEGYLDILNETGVVGLCLLLLMLGSYIKNLISLGRRHLWKWVFVAVLITNLTESTLFRNAGFSGWVFVCAYLALYTELIRTRSVSTMVRRDAQSGREDLSLATLAARGRNQNRSLRFKCRDSGEWLPRNC